MILDQVIFLGAGASKADGAPLQNELFKEFFKLYLSGKFNEGLSESQIQKIEDLYRFVSRFFKNFFGIDLEEENAENNIFPTFEEALVVLELALNRNESFRNYNISPRNPRIQQTREYLISLIGLLLNEKLKGPNIFHKELIKNLNYDDVLSKTGFISTNYDILIDNALFDRELNTSAVDYGVEIKDIIDNVGRGPDTVNLFKLHGSLNWLYCPSCKSLFHTSTYKGAVWVFYEPKGCQNCETTIIPIIIPPSFYKVMSNHFLQQIWFNAEKSLLTVEKIFFCGYSFCDADLHIKYLLKRVEINSNRTFEIFIINEHDKKTVDSRKIEYTRYKRFFQKKNNVNYLDLSFEQFCRNPSQF